MVRAGVVGMVPSVGNDELASWGRRLAADNSSAERNRAGALSSAIGMDGADLIDRAQLLEHLCAAIAAEQARTAAAFADLCHAREDGRAGRDQREQRTLARSAGAQIALARKAAPARGRRLVELSGALVHDLPHTLARLAEGTLTEARALTVAATVRSLSRADRAEVDRLLCSDRARVAHTSGIAPSRIRPAPWPSGSTSAPPPSGSAAPRPTGT